MASRLFSRTGIALLFTFCAFGAGAQSELLGTWKVSCPIEKTSESSGNVCDICPAIFSKETKDLTIKSFEMKFEAKTLFIKTETNLKTTFYKWDDSMRVLEFKYNERRYVFLALYLNNINLLVLREAEGSIVIMERKI